MSHREGPDSNNYKGLGPAGYQEPFPGGKYPSPPSTASEDQNRIPPIQLSEEERQLAKSIRTKQDITRTLPLCLVTYFGGKGLQSYLFSTGAIKKQKPFLTFAATFGVYIFSKIITTTEIQRQLIEKYPDGVVAQTKNMNVYQRIEFAKQQNSAATRSRVGVAERNAEQEQTEKTVLDPDSRNQVAGLDDRNRPTIDSFDFTKKKVESQPLEPTANKTTYADLREKAHRDMSPPMKRSDYISQGQPETHFKQGGVPISDDPPSKLRSVKKNRYGDDME